MLILVQSRVRTGSGRRGALLSVENDILRMAKDYDYRRLRARLSGVVSMEKLRALGASRMTREWRPTIPAILAESNYFRR